jgi:ADP-heptose:LPS heptosyltransferase
MKMLPYIVIAPFSNEHLRDWPAAHFAALIGRCITDLQVTVKVVGTIQQREAANGIIRSFPSDRVENTCGLMTWRELAGVIAQAQAVVGNNSGVVHESAKANVPTVCIFGGEHAACEWMPRGPAVFVVAKHTACSPCARQSCVYGKRCLHEIMPDIVFDLVFKASQIRAPRLGFRCAVPQEIR